MAKNSSRQVIEKEIEGEVGASGGEGLGLISVGQREMRKRGGGAAKTETKTARF